MQGGSIGYNIRDRFKSLTNLRPLLELIPKQETPF